eukprot:8590397-Pyramimonas_sp.AAC.1
MTCAAGSRRSGAPPRAAPGRRARSSPPASSATSYRQPGSVKALAASPWQLRARASCGRRSPRKPRAGAS